MKRKISVSMMLTLMILAVAVTFSVTMLLAMRLFDSTVSSVKEKENMYNKIAEVDRYVRASGYYEIDETTLQDRLTAGYLLGTGDKYAKYYTASAYAELLKEQDGTLMGIGVELGIDQTGYARVTKVYDNSPAEEAGITVGDYITTVNAVDVKNMSGADAVQVALRGEAGTTVSVIWLDGEAVEHTADLTHSGYTENTVDYELLDNGVGYIKIRQFDAITPSELDYALNALNKAGATSLLFDLRNNGGGILDDALRCLDLLCPEGVLAYSEDKDGNRTVLYNSDGDSCTELPIACLVNGSTASAAELFAADLRILNGAQLVGTNTQGKGTIQSSPQRLSDGSAVVITVAKLIAGDGTDFDTVGLTVDVERSLTSDEQTAYYGYTTATDPQILRAANVASQLSGTSTVSAENAASSEAASSGEADASSETASSETASSEAASGDENTTEDAASEVAASSGEAASSAE